jgi:hypothetical protein
VRIVLTLVSRAALPLFAQEQSPHPAIVTVIAGQGSSRHGISRPIVGIGKLTVRDFLKRRRNLLASVQNRFA